MALFIRIFCLAKNLLLGVSKTFFISTFCDFFVFEFNTFIIFPDNNTTFLFPPKLRIFFLLSFPIFIILACPGFSNAFFFLLLIYLPPEIFLPVFIIEMIRIGLYNFWLQQLL